MSDTQTWRYQFPSENGEGWAIIFMDSIGCFTALSDWGNVAYRWPEKGWGEGDFRKFILSCNDDYLIGKFGYGRREYDGEATLKAVQDRLTEAEKDKSYRSTTIAKERTLLQLHDGLDSEYNYWEWVQATSLDLSEGFSRQRYERDVTNFVAKVMPRLRERLKAEVG